MRGSLEEFIENLLREASIRKAAGLREPSIPVPQPKVESVKHDVFTR